MRGWIIVLALLGFPVLEAWVLFRLGESYGAWVLVWLALAVIAGVLLLRLEKLVWSFRVMGSLARNRSPITALLASAKTVIAGVLLIFPGVVSDVIALLVLLWPLPRARPLDIAGEPGVIEGEFRRETKSLPPKR